MSRQLTMPRVTERDDPRRTFETAITQLQQTKPLRLSQQPIFARPRPVLSDPSSEKQAVADAARALARLWNLPSVAIR
jgi:hypothetical protein